MRKGGDVMAELGFNKDSSTETQKAFIKHLFKAAYGVEMRDGNTVVPHQKPVSRQAPTNVKAPKKAQKQGEQLTFDLDKKDDVESA